MSNISILLILSSLLLLGSSRLKVAILVVAIQGLLLGLLPIVKISGHFSLGVWILGLSIILAKGIILPFLLNRSLNNSEITHEIEPFISYGTSIMVGILLLILSGWFTVKFKLHHTATPAIVLSSAFYLILTGLFLMMSRKKALTQALAYLVLGNGVYGVGIGMSLEFPFTVELGILLDVVVGILIMGNLLFHLDSEFSHMDTDKLDELSDNLSADSRQEVGQ